jgi:hypothetical protein
MIVVDDCFADVLVLVWKQTRMILQQETNIFIGKIPVVEARRFVDVAFVEFVAPLFLCRFGSSCFLVDERLLERFNLLYFHNQSPLGQVYHSERFLSRHRLFFPRKNDPKVVF